MTVQDLKEFGTNCYYWIYLLLLDLFNLYSTFSPETKSGTYGDYYYPFNYNPYNFENVLLVLGVSIGNAPIPISIPPSVPYGHSDFPNKWIWDKEKSRGPGFPFFSHHLLWPGTEQTLCFRPPVQLHMRIQERLMLSKDMLCQQ